MKKIIVIAFIISLSLLINSHTALSYNKEQTHPALSRAAVEIANLEEYLTNNLGISKDQPATRWIEYGSTAEDFEGRSLRHFHNPLNNRGLYDIFFGISSVAWGTTHAENEWNWNRAREHYYSALTSSTPEVRDDYFSKMFRALGQVMHLTQDASVPAHVRNDAHVKDPYEEWVRVNVNPMEFDATPFDYSAVPNFRVNYFWDRELYTDYSGSQYPEYTSFPLGAGVAEYTNYHFLSEDTLFLLPDNPEADKHYFPHPNIENTDFDPEQFPEMLYEASDGLTDRIHVINGYGNEPLAAVQYFADIIWEMSDWNIPIPKRVFIRKYCLDSDDDVVHREYADKLVPKAISYSAGLLNFFFRGQMDVRGTYSENGTYSLNLKVQNFTENEEMKGEVTLACWDPEVDVPSVSYPVELKGKGAEGSESEVLTFNNITLSESKDIEEVEFTMAFKGTLGQESEAVVGKVFKVKGPPGIEVIYPEDESEITEIRPEIKARIKSPEGVLVDLSSIEMKLDGSIVAPIFTPDEDASEIIISYTPGFDLDYGSHTVTVNGLDEFGTPADEKVWTFEVGEKPIITGESPTGPITDRKPTIQARIYSPINVDNVDIDLSSIIMTLDGSIVSHTVAPSSGGPNVTASYSPTYDLDISQHTVTVNASDVNGLAAEQKIWSFTIAITGGDWRDVLNLLNNKRADVEKGPVIVSHPEDIDMNGVLTIRGGTVDILGDYAFTGLADALNCAGCVQSTWSEGFDCKNEIRDILNLMKIELRCVPYSCTEFQETWRYRAWVDEAWCAPEYSSYLYDDRWANCWVYNYWGSGTSAHGFTSLEYGDCSFWVAITPAELRILYVEKYGYPYYYHSKCHTKSTATINIPPFTPENLGKIISIYKGWGSGYNYDTGKYEKLDTELFFDEYESLRYAIPNARGIFNGIFTIEHILNGYSFVWEAECGGLLTWHAFPISPLGYRPRIEIRYASHGVM